MRKGMKVMDKEKVKKIFELREQGKTFAGIKKELGVSDASISKYLSMGLGKSLEYLRKKDEEKESLPKLTSEEIESDEKAKDWLSSVKKGSWSSYITGLSYFCAMVEKKPTELIEEAISEIKAGKLKSERRYFGYLPKFKRLLENQKFASTTISGYITGVRSFYGFFEDIDLPKKGNGRKKVKPLKENHRVVVTKEDIYEFLGACRYLRDAAMALAVISGGLGRSEIRELDVRDFAEGYDERIGICVLDKICRIKTDYDYVSFFSTECTVRIWQYLERERGINKENAKNHLDEPLFTPIR
ncbi:MAG: hypothetical protein KAT65_17705, partial [Methanophagales archaeon]|nr:hypothetical protein [Methanophagales archaeon]